MEPSTRKIEFTINEQTLIDVYQVTADELAVACGYPEIIQNPDYIPAVGDEFIFDPENLEAEPTPNPEYVPAVGEREIANTKTKLTFISELMLKAGIDKLAEPYRKAQEREAVRVASKGVEEKFTLGTAAVMSQAVIKVTE